MTERTDADLRALFEDLPDVRETVAPISRDERALRLDRLRALLNEHEVDALLVEPGATLRYLTGLEQHLSERLFALVVLAAGDAFWILPAFEVPRAEPLVAAAGPAGEVVGWHEHEYAWKPLSAALAHHHAKRVAVDPRARAFVVHALEDELGAENVVAGAGLVRALRARKDAHELELLDAANRATKRAIETVAERLEPGTSDHELGRMLVAAQERMGLADVWKLPLYGASASYPHGAPEGRRLAEGDTVLIDTGGSLHGYQSDITRTWVYRGRPSQEVARAWHTLRDAQRAAFDALRPGARCADADRAARAVVEAAGWGDGYAAFAHRLGHGIGLEGHEEPCLDGGSQVRLAPGMTFSNEPGIYLAGRLGLRIEDIVVVTRDGADVFGGWQLGPDSPRSG